jgi:succinate dehydrogenase flavin-adding protein (antitoxin of CptAB toxin-antitoxin module)
MAKALDQEMYNYFIQLNEAEKKSVIQMLKTFLKGRKEQDFNPQTLEEYNRELEEADAAIDAGHFITQEDLEKEMKAW